MKKPKDLIPVLITTDNTKRGVFSAYIKPEDVDKENIEAYEIRMAVYWSSDVKGVLGLAANGPTESCRISPAAIRGIIRGVTSVCELSKKAEKAFKSEPWG